MAESFVRMSIAAPTGCAWVQQSSSSRRMIVCQRAPGTKLPYVTRRNAHGKPTTDADRTSVTHCRSMYASSADGAGVMRALATPAHHRHPTRTPSVEALAMRSSKSLVPLARRIQARGTSDSAVVTDCIRAARTAVDRQRRHLGMRQLGRRAQDDHAFTA